MKCLLILTSLNTLAVDVYIEDYLTTDMDYVFEMKDSQFEKVTLDCQSFINGVNFYEDGKIAATFILDLGECEDIHYKIYTLREDGKLPILSLDFDNREYQINSK